MHVVYCSHGVVDDPTKNGVIENKRTLNVGLARTKQQEPLALSDEGVLGPNQTALTSHV